MAFLLTLNEYDVLHGCAQSFVKIEYVRNIKNITFSSKQGQMYPKGGWDVDCQVLPPLIMTHMAMQLRYSTTFSRKAITRLKHKERQKSLRHCSNFFFATVATFQNELTWGSVVVVCLA